MHNPEANLGARTEEHMLGRDGEQIEKRVFGAFTQSALRAPPGHTTRAHGTAHTQGAAAREDASAHPWRCRVRAKGTTSYAHAPRGLRSWHLGTTRVCPQGAAVPEGTGRCTVPWGRCASIPWALRVPGAHLWYTCALSITCTPLCLQKWL